MYVFCGCNWYLCHTGFYRIQWVQRYAELWFRAKLRQVVFFFFFLIFITYLLICCRIKRRNVTFKMNKEVADFFLFIIALIGVPDLIVLLLLISFYIWIHIIDICTNSRHQRYRLRHKSRVCLQRCVLFQRHANL